MKTPRAFAFACLLILCAGAAFFASCGNWNAQAVNLNPINPPPSKAVGPAVTLPSSLYGTARGMQWWYEQEDGAGALFGVDYAETGCGNCHTAGCDDCHEDAAGTLPVSQPDTCLVCHSRINKEAQLTVSDVHVEAGMVCSDCHSGHEIHGDGNEYESIFASPLAPDCTGCHGGGGAPQVPVTTPHTVHGDSLACDACHMSTAITCYNCHFESLLDTHEKKAAAGFKDFIILVNDQNGKVRGGSYQSVVYENKAFVAYGPYHGHAITSEGRDCGECHGGPRMEEYRDSGRIQMTWWDEDEGKVKHTTGVIPLVPDAMDFQFLTLDGGAWAPMTPAETGVQHEFCSPLTESQLAALGAAGGGAVPPATGYVGSAQCQGCHPSVSQAGHRHLHKLNPATGEFIGPWWTGTQTFGEIPMQFTHDGDAFTATIGSTDYDIIRALGWGVGKWKQRYIVQRRNSWYITPAQWNVVPEQWAAYNAGDWTTEGLPVGPEAAYDRRCTGCHTTGYNVEYWEDTGEWVHGFVEENIRCEACHGPGQEHAASAAPADIKNPRRLPFARQVEVCGACHGRGSSTTQLGGKTLGYPWGPDGPYRPGKTLTDYFTQTTDATSFWQDGPGGSNYHSKSHHQQYNDYLLSRHFAIQLACWQCHDPHRPDEAFTNATCTQCHVQLADPTAFEGHTRHTASQVSSCVYCHMPYIAKNAVAYDVRGHTFEIIPPQKTLDMLEADIEQPIPNSCINGGCHTELSLSSVDDVAQKAAEYDAMFGAP